MFSLFNPVLKFLLKSYHVNFWIPPLHKSTVTEGTTQYHSPFLPTLVPRCRGEVSPGEEWESGPEDPQTTTLGPLPYGVVLGHTLWYTRSHQRNLNHGPFEVVQLVGSTRDSHTLQGWGYRWCFNSFLSSPFLRPSRDSWPLMVRVDLCPRHPTGDALGENRSTDSPTGRRRRVEEGFTWDKSNQNDSWIHVQKDHYFNFIA